VVQVFGLVEDKSVLALLPHDNKVEKPVGRTLEQCGPYVFSKFLYKRDLSFPKQQSQIGESPSQGLQMFL
jgi:hypothetical protein